MVLPARFSLCCFEARLSELETSLKQVLDGRSFVLGRHAPPSSMKGLLQEQRPGGRASLVGSFYEPASARSTSVLISNSVDGWYTLCHALGLHSRKAQILVTDFGSEGTAFHYWAERRDKRTVSAILDGERWAFFQRGARLSFEVVSNYRRRRVRERLNRDSLVDYLGTLLWDLGSPEFWAAGGHVFQVREVRNESPR